MKQLYLLGISFAGTFGLRPADTTTAYSAGFRGPAGDRIAQQHDHNLRRNIHPGGHPERDYREEPFGVP